MIGAHDRAFDNDLARFAGRHVPPVAVHHPDRKTRNGTSDAATPSRFGDVLAGNMAGGFGQPVILDEVLPSQFLEIGDDFYRNRRTGAAAEAERGEVEFETVGSDMINHHGVDKRHAVEHGSPCFFDSA